MHVLGHDPHPATTCRQGSSQVRGAGRAAGRGRADPVHQGLCGVPWYRAADEAGVFVPRDSSEFLAEQAIRRLRRRKHLHVDVATGGGTIALAVADEVPQGRGLGHRRGGRRGASRAQEREGARPPGALRGRRPVRRASEAAAGIRRRGHAPPPMCRPARSTTCPTRSATGNPRTPSPITAPTASASIGRTVAGAPRWLRTNGWLLMEVSPDRVREVGVYTVGGFRDVQSTKGAN